MTNDNNANEILENIATAIFFIDTSLVIHYANNAAEQLFNISARKFIGKTLTQAFEVISLDLERIKHSRSKDLGYTDYEVTFVAEGCAIEGEVIVTPAIIQEKSYILLEIRKNDQQKKLNQESLQHAQQIAAQQLVRNLAHEIKNPLGGLRGAAQLLERLFKNSHEEVKEYTTVIIEQADRLKALVDRLLGPQKALPRTYCNIHYIIEKVRKLVTMDLPSNINIIRDYDPSIPELLLSSEQIEQAILNITCNAAQVLKEHNCQPGIITIRTRSRMQTTINGHRVKVAVVIQIIDNGPGIPPEILDTVFYPMVSRRTGGIGLGLSIAQNIIDQHNGKIECTSEKNHTVFSIILPLKE